MKLVTCTFPRIQATKSLNSKRLYARYVLPFMHNAREYIV